MFSYDSPVFQFIYKLVNTILLGVLCVILSLPIITLGTSVSAMYYTMVKYVRRDEGGMLSCYFHAFRMNLKKGTVLTLILLFVCGFIGTGFYLSLQIAAVTGTFSWLPYLTGCLFVPVLLILPYVFPLLSRFENSIGAYLRNSLYMCFRHFPSTILFGLLIYGTPLLMLFIPRLWSVAFAIPGCICFLVSIPMEQILQQYMPPQQDETEAVSQQPD